MHLSGLFLCADKPQRPKGLHAPPTTVSSSGCCSAGVPVTLTQRKAFEVQKWCRKNNTLSFFSLFFYCLPISVSVFFFLFLLFPNKSDQSTRRLVGGDHDSFRGFVFRLELKALHICKPSNFQSRDVKNHSSSSILIFANPFLCLFYFFFFFTFWNCKMKTKTSLRGGGQRFVSSSSGWRLK